MTKRAWGAVALLGALVIVMIVVAVQVLSSHHHSSSNAGSNQPNGPSADGQPAPPPPAASEPSATNGTGAADGDSVVAGDALTAAHQAMVSYLQSLGSYTAADRQPSWQHAALSFTDGSPAIKAFTHLPTGRAWATCEHTKCTSQSTASVLHDTATTNVAGSGGGPQVVSYVDLTTNLTTQGTAPSTQHTQYTVTATQVGDGWKVSGCTFAGVGDTGANGDGP